MPNPYSKLQLLISEKPLLAQAAPTIFAIAPFGEIWGILDSAHWMHRRQKFDCANHLYLW